MGCQYGVPLSWVCGVLHLGVAFLSNLQSLIGASTGTSTHAAWELHFYQNYDRYRYRYRYDGIALACESLCDSACTTPQSSGSLAVPGRFRGSGTFRTC